MRNKGDFRIAKDSVQGMTDEALFWAVIEPIWPDMSVDDELKHIAQGTTGQRALYVTTLFIREVNNGGLEQFFENSSGMYSEEVLKGFEVLGMDHHADILKKAFSFFPEGKISLNTEERRRHLQKKAKEIEQFFEPLNEQLYGEDQLYPYFKEYIEKHPEEFFK